MGICVDSEQRLMPNNYRFEKTLVIPCTNCFWCSGCYKKSLLLQYAEG